jgi:nucleotide-binding universal stress UspA family protein
MNGRIEPDDLVEMPFGHLVVGEDTSSASQAGLTTAVRVAQRLGARVTVVHVRHEPLLAYLVGFGALYVSSTEELVHTLDSLEDGARSLATRAVAGTGVRWDFQVRAGPPGREILRAVEQLGADLVVIGSNRHSTVRNALLGSTTAYVTAHSPVPVLVARPPAAARPGQARARSPLLTVLPHPPG